MSGPDGFLTRWSRRKLRVEQDEAVPALPVQVGTDAGAPPDAPGSEDTLSAEELAALPSPEDITPDSDITAFMRRGVPDMLRKAALRRMWTLDPAVRDYVGDARDYAWDWNVPGGVPGNGPLGPLDDISASVGRMFSAIEGSDPSAASVPDPPSAEPVAEEDEVSPELVSAESDPAIAPLLPRALEPDSIPASGVPGGAGCSEPAVCNPPQVTEAGSRATPLRRHGAALPKFDLF
jgi:hypothetical protein